MVHFLAEIEEKAQFFAMFKATGQLGAPGYIASKEVMHFDGKYE